MRSATRPRRPIGRGRVPTTAAAQTKAKSDYRFVFAESPDGSPVAGLDDMHTLLQYNLQ